MIKRHKTLQIIWVSKPFSKPFHFFGYKKSEKH
ncbi:hypothetical protein ACWOA5_07010 [Granulicatella adiacens]